MLYLKQSTASQTVLIGPFLDDTDFLTPETGLTIANTDIRLSKNGANIAAKNSGGATHDENGWYQITLDATDTNTVGTLQLHVDVAGALPIWHEFTVLEENVYDAIFAASADLGTDVAAILVDTAEIGAAGAGLTEAGGTGDHLSALPLNDLSAAEVNAEVDTALADYDPPTKAELDSGLAGLNDPTAASIADAVWDESTTGHTTAGTFGEQVKTDVDAILADTNELQSDDIPGTLTTIEGKVDTVDSNVDAILVDTDTTIPGLINGQNDLSAAEVNAEVDSAIETYHLDHLLAVDYDPSSKPGTATALLNELVENDGGVSRFTSNALEEAPTGGSAPTAAEIADAVWDETQADHTTAGSTGESLDNAGSGASASSIADAVWDEAKSGHTSAGSFGEEVQAHALSSEVSALNDFDPTSDDVTVGTNNDKTGYSLSGTINTLDDLMLDVGTAQAGASGSITLRSGASSDGDAYEFSWVAIIGGTGEGQARLIWSYNGSTKVANVTPDWGTAPDATSVYEIIPNASVDLQFVGQFSQASNLWDLSANRILADIRAISNDATAANNLESLLDGTGGVTLSADLDGTINGLTATALADFFDTDSGTSYGSAVAGSVVKETADNAGGSSLTESGIADAVWDEAKSGHVAAGSFGEEVQAHALSSEISALNDVSTTEVNAEVDQALTDYDGPTKAELDSGLAALNDLTAAEVNAEVDSALADYDAPTKAEMDAGFSALNDFDPASDTVTVADINSNVIDDDSLAGDMDVYDARIWLVDNDATPQDNYIVVFYKNGAPVTSGISSPTITVTDASDGSTLVNGDSLSQIGSTVFYKHEEATTRISAGRAYGVQVDWTQDTGSRSAATVLGRDAESS